MVHDFSPFLFQFQDGVGLRWSGVAYVLSFVSSYFLILWLARRQRTGINAQFVGDFVTACAIGALIGARLGYCLFYDFDLLFRFRPSVPFWGILALNEGGLSSHGGIIGLVLTCFWFAARHSVNHLYLFDLVGICGPLGILFGRIANFMNGEFIGREVEPTFPMAMKFPTEIYRWPKWQPDKLAQLGDVVALVPDLKKDEWLNWSQNFKTDPTLSGQINDALLRIVAEIQNGNTQIRDALAPLLVPRHPAQLYGAVLEGLLLFILLWMFWRRPQKAGLVGATFLIAFGFLQLVVERFRMPDAGVGYDWLGLTRGQWLSFAVIVIGLCLSFVWSRSGSVVIPGWARIQSIRINRRE